MFGKKKIRVAINGFGRIGRAFFKAAYERKEIDIVAINDLGDIENLAYLLKYDTVYSAAPFPVSVSNKPVPAIAIGKKKVAFLSEKDPSLLPWKDLKIDIVVESSGFFTKYEEAKKHLVAGARRVVITAPAKDDPADAGVSGGTVLIGVNDKDLASCDISSNASCTTNAASPLIQILNETIGIEKAMLNTTHAYTASQRIVDSPNAKNMREGRAGAANIIPSSTGAAIAVTKAIPALEGKFDGIAMRVPVTAGSIADVTFIAKKNTTALEVNKILTKASKDPRWKKVFAVTNEQVVSSDIVGSKFASIADLSFTRVVGGNLVKVLAWYDNEMGYTHALLEHVISSGSYL